MRPPTDAPTAPILLALSTNTWHAYNDFGGRNLYTGGTHVSLQRPMSAGLPAQAAGAGRRVTTTAPPDPQMAAHVGYLRLNHLSPWAGLGGLARLGAAVPAVGRAARATPSTSSPTPTSRTTPSSSLDGGRTRCSCRSATTSTGRARCATPSRRFIGRGGNAAFFSGNTSFWQVRLEDPTPEGPAATMVGYKGLFKHDPVFGTDRVGELTSIWSDHLIGRPENHMTGVSFARGGYHRIGKRVTTGAGGYTVHRPDHWLFDGTGLGYGDVLGAGGHDRRLRVRRLRLHLPRRPAVPDRQRRHARRLRDPRHRAGGPLHPRPRPPARPPRTSRRRSSSSPSRLFDGSRAPEDVERIAHGHAVLGTYTSPAGGIVVTSGSTDWAHGLAGRDPQVEQITRNLLDRLGT